MIRSILIQFRRKGIRRSFRKYLRKREEGKGKSIGRLRPEGERKGLQVTGSGLGKGRSGGKARKYQGVDDRFWGQYSLCDPQGEMPEKKPDEKHPVVLMSVIFAIFPSDSMPNFFGYIEPRVSRRGHFEQYLHR